MQRIAWTLAAAAAALALGSVGAGAGPEKASKKSCPDGRLCVWAKRGYEGQKVVIRTREVSNELGEKMDDKASSLKLRKSGTAVLYEDLDAEGVGYCFDGPHLNYRNFKDLNFDNAASSTEIPAEGAAC